MGAELTVHDVYAGDVVAKRSEIDALSFADASIARLCMRLRREVVYALDFTGPRYQSFAEFPQIQPIVRGTLQRPVVEIESIDVGVNFH